MHTARALHLRTSFHSLSSLRSRSDGFESSAEWSGDVSGESSSSVKVYLQFSIAGPGPMHHYTGYVPYLRDCSLDRNLIVGEYSGMNMPDSTIPCSVLGTHCQSAVFLNLSLPRLDYACPQDPITVSTECELNAELRLAMVRPLFAPAQPLVQSVRVSG